MTEEELRLFSEFLGQKEYAIKDYFFAVENKAGISKTANSPGIIYNPKTKQVFDYHPMDKKNSRRTKRI